MESPYQDMSKKEILEEYTEVMRSISEHIDAVPDAEMHYGLVENWGDYQVWFDKLKVLVGEEQ